MEILIAILTAIILFFGYLIFDYIKDNEALEAENELIRKELDLYKNHQENT